jgi:uncharacterized protein (DUF2267 family)
VANHLNADVENVRLVLHGAFAALHSQITEAEAEKVASQLPDYVKGTWLAARRAWTSPTERGDRTGRVHDGIPMR